MTSEQSSRHSPKNGAGTAALALGGIAAVVVFVPLLGIFVAGPTGIGALFCGLVGIARAEEGSASNKGTAVAGALLGLGSTVGVIVTIAAMIGPVNVGEIGLVAQHRG